MPPLPTPSTSSVHFIPAETPSSPTSQTCTDDSFKSIVNAKPSIIYTPVEDVKAVDNNFYEQQQNQPTRDKYANRLKGNESSIKKSPITHTQNEATEAQYWEHLKENEASIGKSGRNHTQNEANDDEYSEQGKGNASVIGKPATVGTHNEISRHQYSQQRIENVSSIGEFGRTHTQNEASEDEYSEQRKGNESSIGEFRRTHTQYEASQHQYSEQRKGYANAIGKLATVGAHNEASQHQYSQQRIQNVSSIGEFRRIQTQNEASEDEYSEQRKGNESSIGEFGRTHTQNEAREDEYVEQRNGNASVIGKPATIGTHNEVSLHQYSQQRIENKRSIGKYGRTQAHNEASEDQYSELRRENAGVVGKGAAIRTQNVVSRQQYSQRVIENESRKRKCVTTHSENEGSRDQCSAPPRRNGSTIGIAAGIDTPKESNRQLSLLIHDVRSDVYKLVLFNPEIRINELKDEIVQYLATNCTLEQIEVSIETKDGLERISDSYGNKRLGDFQLDAEDIIHYEVNHSRQYRSPSSFQRDRDVDLGLCGLENAGNKCFMNSVLQCLSSIEPLTKEFRKLEQRRKNTGEKSTTILIAYADLISNIWSEKNHCLSYPEALTDSIIAISPRFGDWEQQDALEFMTILLDALHEELKGNNIDDKTIITDLFHGQLKTTVVCCKCSKRTETREAISFLALPLWETNRQGSITLDDCFKEFKKIEKIDEKGGKWYCERCNCLEEANKKIALFTLPQVLIIQLKRFEYDRRSYMNEKIETLVKFPLEDLNLNDYINNPEHDTNIRYDLVCLSKHMGTLNGGHYVTYAKRGNNKWYCFNDSWVYPINEETVVTNGAYILIYQQQKKNENY